MLACMYFRMLSILLLCVSVVLGQEHCCAPSAFEGHDEFVFAFSMPGEVPDAALVSKPY